MSVIERTMHNCSDIDKSAEITLRRAVGKTLDKASQSEKMAFYSLLPEQIYDKELEQILFFCVCCTCLFQIDFSNDVANLTGLQYFLRDLYKEANKSNKRSDKNKKASSEANSLQRKIVSICSYDISFNGRSFNLFLPFIMRMHSTNAKGECGKLNTISFAKDLYYWNKRPEVRDRWGKIIAEVSFEKGEL